MQSLPYEILQHVAGNLLPRYQCRFALTSRQNYDYLYSPLLRWHAQKQIIMTPEHNMIAVEGCVETLLFTGKNVVLYRSANIAFGKSLYEYYDIVNLSTCTFTRIHHKRGVKVKYFINKMRIFAIYDTIGSLPSEYLKRYVRYLHKNVLLILINMRSIPYINYINTPIRRCIKKFLSEKDISNINSCDHLSISLG